MVGGEGARLEGTRAAPGEEAGAFVAKWPRSSREVSSQGGSSRANKNRTREYSRAWDRTAASPRRASGAELW